MTSLASSPRCSLCPEVAARAAGSLEVWICGDCGKRYRPANVWRAPESPELEQVRTPLERADQRASALSLLGLSLTPEEGELARIRVVLTDLRPDHPDPLVPMPARAEIEVQTIRVHAAAGEWGGIPRALVSPMAGMLARAELATRAGADVLAEIEREGGYDAPTLRWLRHDAKLTEGTRALFFTAGAALATRSQRAAWEGSLTARRDGAYAVGRGLVLRAVGTWERVMGGRR